MRVRDVRDVRVRQRRKGNKGNGKKPRNGRKETEIEMREWYHTKVTHSDKKKNRRNRNLVDKEETAKAGRLHPRKKGEKRREKETKRVGLRSDDESRKSAAVAMKRGDEKRNRGDEKKESKAGGGEKRDSQSREVTMK